MPENKNVVIKKHSGLIQTNVGNLTLTQRKAINFFIYVAQRSGNCKTYQTTISNIKQVCNLLSTDNIVIKEQLRALTKTTIEFNYLNKDKQQVWEISTLLAGCRILPDSGVVEFAFSPFLLERILYPEMYAPLNLILISGLKCSYAVVLYEFLRDYLTAPSVPVITIDDFRNLLGINKEKYTFFPNFTRNVLNPAVEEVNLKTDICCRFELVKEEGIRNKYSHIRFFVNKKSGNLTYEKNADLKKENTDINMNLFEEYKVSDNQIEINISEEIIMSLPELQRTNVVKGLISQFSGKSNDYIISNIKYSLKKAKDNFPAYLKQSLENDYAGHERESLLKAKKNNEKISKNKAEAEKKKFEIQLNDEIIMKRIFELSKTEKKKYEKKALEIAKMEGIKQEFYTDAVKRAFLIKAYESLHEQENYNQEDLD